MKFQTDTCNGSGINEVKLRLVLPNGAKVDCQKEEFGLIVNELKNKSILKFQTDTCNGSGINEVKLRL